jgi:ubiquinone/menaquinone biosynthesis C-methylase UbiE
MESMLGMLTTVASTALDIVCGVPIVGPMLTPLKFIFGAHDDQSVTSLFVFLWKFRKFDFENFMKGHRAAYAVGQKTGDYCSGVCNYYEVMSEVITLTSGPYWHFVPMAKGVSRKESHDRFHHTIVEHLQAKAGDKVLEFGCGFGEIGRQVAKISGAGVTGLTMSDAEITGGNDRIRKAGLQDRCVIVQGNYHKMPFEANSFDKVFGVYCLKYSADLDTAISEAARVLKSGGRLCSYEIIVTDKYNKNDKQHFYYVDNISASTCMPPLWPAQAFRDAAKKAGLKPVAEVDLCKPPAEAWFSCFERTYIHDVLSSSLVLNAVKLAETLHILPKSFSEFFEACIIHPTTDFTNAGRMGIIDGALMMVWEKP